MTSNTTIAPERIQRAASDPRSSVWVAASAGSGKTKVLTDRVIRLLLDGVKPEKILCLTFTRAGAAEMAIRITGRLAHWATCKNEDLDRELDELEDSAEDRASRRTRARRLFARVLACPGGMRIRTIHAFCQEILGRFPIEAGLPPYFSVIDENESRNLMDEALADLLRELEAKPESAEGRALAYLAEDQGEQNFKTAMQQVFRDRTPFDAALRRTGGIDQLISEIRQLLDLEPGDKAESIIATATGPSVLPDIWLRHAHCLLEGGKNAAKYGKGILDWLALDEGERVQQFELYWRSFLTKEQTPYKTITDKDLRARYPDLEEILQAEAERLQTVLERLEAVDIAERSEAVFRLGHTLIAKIEQRKTAQAALDYEDLIIRTNRLLQREDIAEWVLFKLDGGLEHMLVDEAQDTSLSQWNIVQALTAEFFAGETAKDNRQRTLFVVGDEKQSIFSFQKADPEAFAAMNDYFRNQLRASGSELRLLPMRTSFRSAPKVLEVVDQVFAADAARAGVAKDTIIHVAASPRTGDAPKLGHVEVWEPLAAREQERLELAEWDMPSAYEEEHDPQATLASLIAQKIAAWRAAKTILPGMEKPVRPGDIMILLRRRGRFADLMVRALKKVAVPVTGVDRMHLTRQLPVMDLLAIIQFMLLPEDDLNLATVLRGPLLGCSEDQLMALAIGREGSLWRSLEMHAGSDSLFAAMADYLKLWLSAADFVTPFSLIARILNERCPGNQISGRKALWARLGPDALDPIEELLNAAQDFSTRRVPSLEAFLHWITAADAVIKRELDQGTGQVRIMTVHGSKGLEAPIVFLPDTTDLPDGSDVDQLLWHKDGLPLYLSGQPTAGAAAQIWSAAFARQMEEYRRLLYVALTRASRRLYIAGWAQSNKTAYRAESWFGLIEAGLRPLHQPEAIEPDSAPIPIIALADPLLHAAPKPTAKDESQKIVTLPAWVSQAAPAEPELMDIFAPSHLEAPAMATPDSAFTRGRIIHRLMQSLPDVPPSKREAAAARFLSNPQHVLAEDEQKSICAEVMQIFRPEFEPLFGPLSRAEVPLTGQLDGHAIAGQVDRLCVHGDEVWVVDYKTNRPPPLDAALVPAAYLRQMQAYRAALREIYAGKTVRCFLLWTYTARLMEIEASGQKH